AVGFLFSPDGKSLIGRTSAAAKIREWEVASGKQMRGEGADPHGGLVGLIHQLRLILSPDAKTLVLSGTSQIVRFVDRESGKEINVATHPLEAQAPMDLARFSPDGKRLWTQQFPGLATLKWDAETGKFLGKLSAKLSDRAVFSTGGRFVMKPDEEHGEIQVV